MIIRDIDRTIPKNQLYYFLDHASIQNLLETITDCFYIRDHRKGRGERALGRLCFNWIADRHPMLFLRVMRFIPEYGRWDDLLHIQSEYLQPYINKYISNQIHHDILQMVIGCPISTCAKWMPSEGKSFARHYASKFYSLLQELGMDVKEYRIKISTLRRYLNIPEHALCLGKHVDICDQPLTRGARKLYRKILLLEKTSSSSYTTIRSKNEDEYRLITNQLRI